MKPHLRSVDLNLLTVFDAVMREPNFSAAAVSLGMTQPAVSNAVARLRDTFGDALFVRGRHGMTPTPRARELVGPVREALDIIRGALDPAADFDPSRSDRVFHLALGDYGELVLLPFLLRRLRDCGGNLAIHTYPEHDPESLALVKEGRLDFFFDYRPPEDDQLDACVLGEEEAVVIARRRHPVVKRRLTKKMYLEAGHVVLGRPHPNQTLLEALWRDRGPLPRRVAARVRQYAAMPRLVAQSDCLATVPRRMAEQAARGLPIAIHRLPFDLGPIPTWMVWNRALERDKGHAWLKQAILEIAAG